MEAKTKTIVESANAEQVAPTTSTSSVFEPYGKPVVLSADFVNGELHIVRRQDCTNISPPFPTRIWKERWCVLDGLLVEKERIPGKATGGYWVPEEIEFNE